MDMNGQTPKHMGEPVRRLIELRRKKTISREKAANEIGVASSTLYRWEKGLCSPRGLSEGQLEAYLKKNER